MGGGQIAIVGEPEPTCPEGGLLVRTEASGLCSGELMDWYMDRKIPHVLGHEVAGIVVESQDSRFPVGCRVAPHHHAPCMTCDLCQRGAYVHCEQWKRTKLVPGGMAEYFAVGAENLTDCHILKRMRARDAALIEPLGCVMKSLFQGGLIGPMHNSVAVIGLGSMGLLHALLLTQWSRDAGVPHQIVGYDVSRQRLDWAASVGVSSRHIDQAKPAEVVIVCPGTEAALSSALNLVLPGGSVILFSPLAPPGKVELDINRLYFQDVRLVTSYSCGPIDTHIAKTYLNKRAIRAEQVVSHFLSIDELPDAYQAMKRGEILKPMVLFEP